MNPITSILLYGRPLLVALCLLGGLITLNGQNRFNNSNLPIVQIETERRALNAEQKSAGKMQILFRGEGERNAITDTEYAYEGPIAIKYRGKSSLNFAQKQYALETRDSAGENLNVSLLGMRKENDWVLYAPYNDISMIRNVFAYTLWREMGHWGPRTRMVELLLNNEYQGVYVLIESIKVDKGRVNIDKLKPDNSSGTELTGGYILKIDEPDRDDHYFVSKVEGLFGTARMAAIGPMGGPGGKATPGGYGMPMPYGYPSPYGFPVPYGYPGRYGTQPPMQPGTFPGGNYPGGPIPGGAFPGSKAPGGKGPGGTLEGAMGGAMGGMGGMMQGLMGGRSTIKWVVHYPKAENLHPEQAAYIQTYIDNLEALFQSHSYCDTVNGYRKYIDLPSFVDYFIHTELSMNADGYKKSTYFYKERDSYDGTNGKLFAGPVWDYNIAFGNCNFCNGNLTDGWAYEGCTTLPLPAFWQRLVDDPAFMDAVKSRYRSLRQTALSTQAITQFIDSCASHLDEAQVRHFAKWNQLLNGRDFTLASFSAYTVSSYPEEIATLKTWLQKRLAFLDREWD